MSSDFLPFALACANTYDANNKPKFENLLKTVHIFESEIDGILTFAWEGTSDKLEWFIDFLAIDVRDFVHPELGPIHFGFWTDLLSIMPILKEYLEHKGWPEFYNTGHSKGAAEAILFHAMMKADGHAPKATYAFEPPRVGTQQLLDYLKDEPIFWTKTVNIHGPDKVCTVPFHIKGFDYLDLPNPLVLTVPDAYDIATKHRIPAVIEAINKLP